MKHRIAIAELKESNRPPEYLFECMKLGTVEGGMLLLSEDDYEALRVRFSPRGIGDLVARVAKPIARAVDAKFGTNLEHCAGCAERQKTLNEAVPFR